MTDTTNPETVEPTEPEAVETPETEAEPQQPEPDTFPRDYVEKLRKEAAEARQRAKRTEDLERELFTERVRATGRLADPTDLPFDPELLTAPAKLSEAVDTLLTSKPHLASRTPRGDVGQGATGASGSVDLAGMLRARA